MLPNTAATIRQSSAVPTTDSTIMAVVGMTGTLLEGVASTPDTVLIVDVVNCVLDSERCVPISGTLLTSGVTTGDCDGGVSAKYVDTVKQLLITMSLERVPQHILPPLVQLVQSLL